MSPIQAFSKLLHVNPVVGNILLAGLAILAAAAIAVSWGNVANLVPLGITIVALGVAVTIISVIFRNEIMQTVLAWIAIAGVVVVLGLGLDAMLGRKGMRIAPPLPCWPTLLSELPEQCLARLTSTTRVAVVRPTPVPPSTRPAVPPRPRPPSSIATRPSPAPTSPDLLGDDTLSRLQTQSLRVRPPSSQDDVVEAPVVVPAPEPGPREVRSVPLPDTVAVRLSASGTERVSLRDVDRSLARVVTYAPSGDLAAARAAPLATALEDSGWPDAARHVEVVAPEVKETEIRYYHASDAGLATALAADLARLLGRDDVPVRDFSQLGLRARTGLLEIWLDPGA
ncbi:MAG: hypothetical protein AAFP13_04490 [Pseudomonadota bacterium]